MSAAIVMVGLVVCLLWTSPALAGPTGKREMAGIDHLYRQWKLRHPNGNLKSEVVTALDPFNLPLFIRLQKGYICPARS